MVELALTVLVLLTVMFGVVEFSRALYTYHFVSNAAREATRYAMVRGASCTSWGTACPASATDIQNYVKGIVPTGIDPSAITVTTTWNPDNKPGSSVQVTVQYNLHSLFAFLPSSGSRTLTSTSQMVISQ